MTDWEKMVIDDIEAWVVDIPEGNYLELLDIVKREIKQFAREIRITADEKMSLELMRVFAYQTNIDQLLKDRGIE